MILTSLSVGDFIEIQQLHNTANFCKNNKYRAHYQIKTKQFDNHYNKRPLKHINYSHKHYANQRNTDL